jgi:DNA-binding NarL/FixJ family response regulator
MTQRRFQLILIEDDPIFRLGLRTALQAFPNLYVMAEAETPESALQKLAEGFQAENSVDLVVLELNLGRVNAKKAIGFQLCQQIKTLYPQLPILLLSEPLSSESVVAAQQIGVEGYCPKGTNISVLVQAMQQLLAGNVYWTAVASQEFASPIQLKEDFGWRSQWRQSGLRQIEGTLAEVTTVLQNPQLSTLDWLIWSGRRRELKAAHWLVKQLLPSERAIASSRSYSLPRPQNPAPSLLETPSTSQVLNTSLSLFDQTRTKLQLGLQNLTDSPLEIDILREDKKRELLELLLRKLEAILAELQFSQVQREHLSQKLPIIMRDLWQAGTTEFFGKYYTLWIGQREYEVVNILLQDAAIVQTAILSKIPLPMDLFDQLLFTPSTILDQGTDSSASLEVKQNSEFLLENLLIQVANAVVQPLLNHFPDIEIIKQNFYDRRFISTREIEKFRNNLSWNYRLKTYIFEPKAIFESQYNLLILQGTGIQSFSLYAPRRLELEQLTGIQLAVTLVLEMRDAIAPRLQATVSFLGKGAIYVLTQVIGRGIGLIGRGIIQGIGNTLQESRFGKNSERQK